MSAPTEIKVLKIVIMSIIMLGALDISVNMEGLSPGWHTKESITRTVHNLTNLVYQYYLVCGAEYICEKHNYNFIINDLSMQGLELCPLCSCKRECVQAGNCCPDIMFAFPVPLCKHTSIVDNVNDVKLQSHIIEACHDDSLEEDKEKCKMNYTRAQLMQHPPVTSADYAFTFRNKHCAECNGVFNYSSWKINISCTRVTDFNFLSTYEEIVDQATSENCIIEYGEDQDSSTHKCVTQNTDPVESISECNVTGTWLTYDKDIANACLSSYHLEYKGYKNIFCLMCNPPLYYTNPIVSCNVSGIWSPYNSTLLEACTRHLSTTFTMPYKNVFCFLCNRNNNGRFRFQDANAIIEEISVNRNYVFVVRMTEYALDYYYSVLQSSRIDVNNIVRTQSNNGISVDKTKLLSLHYAIYGTNSYCSTEFAGGFFENSTCLCNESCLFRFSEPFCCHDFLLNSKTSCFNTLLSGSTHFSSSIGAISGCSNLTEENVIRNRCERSEAKDIFGTLPVTDGNTIYKNLDCFRCNHPTHNLTRIHPSYWKFSIFCDSYPHFNYFISVMEIIQQAKRRSCVVRIIPESMNDNSFQMSKIYCNPNSIDRCNVTGLWSTYDKDIAVACERLHIFLPPYNGFKNVYCYICNNPTPSSFNETTIDRCLIPAENQLYGESIMTACTTLPEVPGFGQYRNIFCEKCSLENSTILAVSWKPSIPFSGLSQTNIRGSVISARDLFIALSPMVSIEIQALEIDSENNILFDKRQNRKYNLTCFPGKILMDKKCKPLLKITDNLRYVQSFSLEGNSTLSPEILLLTVKEKTKSAIYSISGILFFDSFHIVLNNSCDENFTGSAGIRMLIHASFLIEAKVDRLETEKRLVEMTKEEFNFDNTTYLKASPSVEAFMIPVVLKTLSFSLQCHITESSSQYYSLQPTFRPAVVSDLLLCTHVVLNSQEYEMDGTDLSLTFGKSNRFFTPLEYIFVDKEARICLDDFRQVSENFSKTGDMKSEINTALGIFSLICTVISLVCLVLTFITYCLFPVMRSIPGINNMNLVFIMFCAQLLFQVGFDRIARSTLCAAIGIFIHFFWLSTFTCMNVCSFHMYTVFAGDLVSGRITERWKRRIFMYMLYSHGLPCAVIILNIIVLSSTSEDGGIGYGYTSCFISNNVSFYITFLAPVLLICISNIYFFTRTALKIKETPKVDSTLEKRNDFIIYVKLFSLTGITWILLVVDTLFTVSVFSFLVVFFTVCQGLFVFISFVANKRVLKRYANFCCGKTKDGSRGNASSNTAQTTMTTSSAV
ncbi:uncharacterized protein LOC132544650 [Ylistrum balloti]|uniref:uncharacterized protein LOC132544650 n=1 Tax=Ylistrum balloti TaxID=509963 RepID=UPI002905F7B5|nr:uncharacterized protein LOC132544650 [Ylistrum balloti]